MTWSNHSAGESLRTQLTTLGAKPDRVRDAHETWVRQYPTTARDFIDTARRLARVALTAHLGQVVRSDHADAAADSVARNMAQAAVAHLVSADELESQIAEFAAVLDSVCAPLDEVLPADEYRDDPEDPDKAPGGLLWRRQ